MTLPLAIGTALGFGLVLALAAYYGLAEIGGALAGAGWGILALLLFHLVQMLCSALGWRALLPATTRPRLASFLGLRWIREAVNNLLPVAQIGGEVVAARLLRRAGVPLPVAGACVTLDLTMEMASQILFTLIGLALLLADAQDSQIAWVAGAASLAAAGILACFMAAQRLGGFRLLERALLALARRGYDSLGAWDGLHEAILSLYSAPARLGLAGFWHLVSWLLGGFEVMLALHLLGVSIDLPGALVIESLGQAIRCLGFMIPGSLGVQEGGYVLVCGLVGIPPQAAIALSLLKRAREIALGIPALFAWHALETRWLVARAAAPVRVPAALDGD